MDDRGRVFSLAEKKMNIKINFRLFGDAPSSPIAAKVETTEAVKIVLRALNVYSYS